MPRFEELYSANQDEMAREQGLVYVEDIAISGLMIALKVNCAPQGLGFLHANPVERGEVTMLHADLVDAMREIDVTGSEHIQCFQNRDIFVEEDFRDGRIIIGADYWQGRPLKTIFKAGENLDREILTGFESFDPQGFDRNQGSGMAQRVVDDLRYSGDPMSLEVVRNEEGRTFKRAREAEKMFNPLTEPELCKALEESLANIRNLSDR